jgi:malate dehydrogenase (quinone)
MDRLLMLTVLQKVFKDKVATLAWQEKLHQIVPSYGTQLNSNPAKVAEEWAYTAKVLELTPPPAIGQVAAPAAAPAAPAKAPKANAATDMAL